MAKTSKNLGLISAIHVGTTNPSNIYQIWYNLGDGLHYYYDSLTLTWKLLSVAGSATLGETLENGPYTNGNDIKISSASGDGIVYVNAANTKSISLVANPSAGNFTQTFQDKSGTIALTSDITATLYNGNGTVGAGRVATITDYIAFNGGEFRTENGYWQGTNKILYINPNGTTGNLFVGENSGNNTMTGLRNTAFGSNSLISNTSGGNNTSLGYNTLYFNTIGNANVAIGYQSLYTNDSGVSNMAIGHQSLFSNTTGGQNVAIGYQSLSTNTSGSGNTVVGYQGMGFNTTGSQNTVIGREALYSNSTGSSNVALGLQAGYYETGSNKLFIDNTARANEADGRAKALIYGIFDAAVANQRFNINASVGIGGGVANGTSVLNIANLPVSSVGLVSGDVWNNGGILTIV